jgi:pilus assembly protein CpaB
MSTRMKIPVSRSGLILGVALVMGSLAAFAIHRYIEHQVEDIEARSKATRTLRVLVPKEDLARGTTLTPKVVAVREIPAEWGHSNAITPEQFDRVENQRLAYPAARGEALLWSLLEGQRAPSFSSRLLAGRRAITVPVDEVNSISGMIEPGDRIDLMVSVRKDSRAFMFPLLQNVAILATGARAVVDADTQGGRRSYTTITLEAAPDEAQRVLAAREVGKLAAVLRAPGDAAKQSAARRDAMALLGLADTPRVPEDSSVPVLYGNRGALKELPRLGGPREPAAGDGEPGRPLR